MLSVRGLNRTLLARQHLPRGLWKRSGGVVYQTVERHLDRPATELDVRELVRRYLRASGPLRRQT